MPQPSYLMSFTANQALAEAIAKDCEAQHATSAAAVIRAVLCKHYGLPVVSPRRLRLSADEREALIRKEERIRDTLAGETQEVIEAKAKAGSGHHKEVCERMAWRA